MKTMDKKRSPREIIWTTPTEPGSLKTEQLEVRAGPDVDAARRSVQVLAAAIGMDDSNQDMIGTATSELARNMLDHGWSRCCRVNAARACGSRSRTTDRVSRTSRRRWRTVIQPGWGWVLDCPARSAWCTTSRLPLARGTEPV